MAATAQERPYVSVNSAEIGHNSFGSDVPIAFAIANDGSAPARNVRVEVTLRFPGWNPRNISTPEGIVLFPANRHVLSFYLTSEEVQHIASVWEFSVTVRYEGAADRRYLTNATFRYQGVLRGFVMSAGEFE